jgi:glycosyltransferase involved in cell wall biosynthesis
MQRYAKRSRSEMMRNMRIMELTDFYHPIIGGLERHVETLSKEFIRLGHSVVVVTLQPGGQASEEVIDGVRVIRISGWSQRLTPLYADATHPFHPTAPDPGAVAALRRVIRQEQPTVVNSNSWIGYSFLPLYRPHEGPAHVMTLHDYGLACPRKTLWQSGSGTHCQGPSLARCLMCAPEQYGVLKGTTIATLSRASRVLHGRIDRYIAISDAVATASHIAIPKGKEVTVIPAVVPNGLSKLAAATSRPAFLPPDDGYLMFVGALGPHKGIDVLLEAHRRMRHKLPLVVIGTPRNDTPSIDGPRITLAHNLPTAQVMAAWMRASIGVVPSTWSEPMGLVAVEAMLVGCPVVASDVGGLRDVVEHDRTGLLVPAGDPGALAAALDRLLDEPVLRQRLGDAGRVRGQRFEAAAVAPQVLEVFDAALAVRSAGKRTYPRS